MLDAVVRVWLHQVLGKEAAIEEIGEMLDWFMVAFYVDDGIIASRCPHELQEAVDVLIDLFD